MRLIIKEIREQKKMTQDEIVSLCGIKKRTYVDYENGKSDIPFSKLQLIATALNVSFFDLFDNKPTNYEFKSDIIAVVEQSKPLYGMKTENSIEKAQQKTIAILEQVVEELREDKNFLKSVIDNKKQKNTGS